MIIIITIIIVAIIIIPLPQSKAAKCIIKIKENEMERYLLVGISVQKIIIKSMKFEDVRVEQGSCISEVENTEGVTENKQ